MVSRLILVALLWGCGRVPSESRLHEVEKPSRLRVVGMGGRNSCQKIPPFSPKSMSMYAEIQKSVEKLTGDFSQIDMLLACYRADGELYYVNSQDDKIKKGDPQDLIASVNGDPAPTLFVGHSYGGWLAMQTLLRSNVKASLFTIDAISPVNCAILRPQRWLGCIKAPTDVPYDQVAQKTFYWGNFFQTSTPYLHSSQIPQASQNVQLNGVSHTTIDNVQDIWSDFVSASNKMRTITIPEHP